MFRWLVMGHYTLHALICLCSYYICASVTLDDAAATAHKATSQVVVPSRVTSSGQFVSHEIPRHWLRSAAEDSDSAVHYHLPIDGQTHHLELRPSRELLSPGALAETHGEAGFRVRRVSDVQCHYSGGVRGEDGSVVAVSTCRGLAGYIHTQRGHFVIEPLALTDEHHPHVVYQRHDHEPAGLAPPRGRTASNCETKGSNEKLLSKRNKRNIHKSNHKNVTNMYSTTVKNDLYLELLLVLDKSFLNYHKPLDVEQYVMTVMNMAHTLFAQESLGRPVYLSVVRIIQMEDNDNEINLALVKEPSKLLKNFEDWQHKMNPGDDSHPNHHDLAVLFTRVDIFADDDNHDFLGMAEQAGACNPQKQAVICQDVGLALGYIVAHVIGHSLGFLHDDIEDTGCSGILPNGCHTVMNPNIQINTADWSMCSKQYLRIFAESGFGHCLQDIPADHPFAFVDDLPGTIYDGDWQCRSKYGSNASLCNTAPRCDSMLCQVPYEGCIDSSTPAADGTYCGEAKWCYHKECLQRGMRPMAKDGGWGPWGTWSTCSRTCGTGVAFTERRCDSPQPANGGLFCKGPKRKYKICSAEPCAMGTKTFRDVQCEHFNDWVFPEDGILHKWRASPVLSDDPCVLVCVNENGTVANLLERVVDGTSCMRGMRDVCIAGKCVTVPCDLNMDSGAVEDVCGVCHGDGTTCSLKEGTKYFELPPANMKQDRAKDEIIKLIDVPDGSENIHVEESEPTKSKIQVRDADGNTVFVEGNGLGLFEVPGSRAWLGEVRTDQQTLHISGPVTETLTIWVSPMQNVTYTYSLAVQTEKRQGAFQWDLVEWTPCSTHCGLGTSLSISRCVEQSSGIVDDRYCEGLKPPQKAKTCEMNSCPPRWFIGDWSKCSNPRKIRRPLQTRVIRCSRPVGGEVSDLVFIRSSHCSPPKPVDHQDCALPTFGDDPHGRQKRKVFHRPNRPQSKHFTTWRHKSKRRGRRVDEIVKRDTKAKHKAKVKEDDEKYGHKFEQQFSMERGRVDIDKQSCKHLQLMIKHLENTNEEEENSTIPQDRSLFGNMAVEELDKLEKKRPPQDQI